MVDLDRLWAPASQLRALPPISKGPMANSSCPSLPIHTFLIPPPPPSFPSFLSLCQLDN